jgi:hypothetical protein
MVNKTSDRRKDFKNDFEFSNLIKSLPYLENLTCLGNVLDATV